MIMIITQKKRHIEAKQSKTTKRRKAYQREKMMQQEQSPSSIVSTIPTIYYISLKILKKKNIPQKLQFQYNSNQSLPGEKRKIKSGTLRE